jgi:hypothetical protein
MLECELHIKLWKYLGSQLGDNSWNQLQNQLNTLLGVQLLEQLWRQSNNQIVAFLKTNLRK